MARDELTRFVEYLQSLAQEGETPLLVRQVPKLVDGEMQFHANGAIKATWPAFLPAKALRKIKDDQAWYGNTACFILDRMRGGASAAAANCEYCMVMVLDDIGTKSKEPPLAPTWKMETSPGSFQWGYTFSFQPSKQEFAAAITAIAAAGYTDPGANNPVRNFRLPGSINLKPGRNGWAARLVELEPSREYTLEEICKALGVTPGPEDGGGIKPIKVADDGNDDVFAWLGERGLVLSKPNPEGWAGVVCPNHAEHTDGSPEGRYNPSVRAYCCMHGHCGEWGTHRFLEWVAEQGGPAHDGGLRDDLLALTMGEALAKLKPTEAFPDAAAKEVKAAEDRQEIRDAATATKSEWYTRFMYSQGDDTFFDTVTRQELPRHVFNATFRHISCRSIHGRNPKIEAGTCYDENREAMGARVLAGMTYAPGRSLLVTANGLAYGNKWRDARRQGVPGNIVPWLEHCRRLVPDADQLGRLFDVMAFKLQHPDIKINHAILHGGTQGCGKDSMWAPLLWALGGDTQENIGRLDARNLESQFNTFAECELLWLNELREPEAAQRRMLANRLKPVIAAPPIYLEINRKNRQPYNVLNVVLVVACTNERLPISLESADRRWYCIWSEAPRMTDAAGKALWDWFQRDGFAAVAAWLYARDVSAFNPGACPPMTDWKHSLIDNGLSSGESYLVEMIRGRVGEFARGVVGSPFYALADRLAGGAPSAAKVHHATVIHALSEAGWRDLGRVASADYPSKKQLWVAPELAAQVDRGDVSRSDLRRLVEAVPTPVLKVAK